LLAQTIITAAANARKLRGSLPYNHKLLYLCLTKKLILPNTFSMFDNFASRHIGVTNPEELNEMLSVIGVGSVDELIAQVIPQSIRLKKPLNLPKQGMSE